METKSLIFPFFHISSHLGFHGSIKNSVNDFVVTEISLSGQLVSETKLDNLQNQGEPVAEKSLPVVKKRKSDNEQQRSENASENNYSNLRTAVESFQTVEDCGLLDQLEVNSSSDLIEECDLDSVLAQSVIDALEQFAYSMKTEQDCEPSPVEAQTGFLLGSFPSKDHRARIHHALRKRYPFLMTITNGGEMTVKLNPLHKQLCKFVTEHEADDFFRFLDAKINNSAFSFRSVGDKEHRKNVHHFICKNFGKLVEAKTFSEVSSVGERSAAITVRFKGRCASSKKRNTAEFQDDKNIYTAFTLQKENMETLEAITYLATKLDVLPSDFSYAGIKDKKAVTFQTMVVKKVAPKRLKDVEAVLESKGLKVFHIHPVKQHLRLGQLKGNHFDIMVRNLKVQSQGSFEDLEQAVSEAFESAKVKGFVNYYGPQRFGQGQYVQADQIGLALLKGDMVKAVKLFFTPEDVDDPVNKAKKHFLQTADAKGTLAVMPEFKVRERMILRALNRYGMDKDGCTRAWFSIPHSMRIFYVHAYCSKVWNQAASYRFETYGQKVVEGDLVILESDAEKEAPVIHVVTAEEEASAAYPLHQVVLPMPGKSISYPCNKVGQWYEETLTKSGLSACSFRIPELQLNIPGCYRQIVAYPQNLTYHFIEDPESCMNDSINEQRIDETFKAVSSNVSLSLSFDLDRSCYATVFLQELMKCEH
ncbi:pseudouridylate synthase 7 homolog-like protein [Protopterus annectens]|uniref:pseudouridylate synthase 7 homolog-like protein n=1 Tax=Protopterus annectens TaxID=7888 RepID=UPI001CFB4112|nr:pseudouridylate synthase 7 homolog-like protein [Protopterus annectens]